MKYRLIENRTLTHQEVDDNFRESEEGIATLMALSSLLGKQVSCIPTSGLSYAVVANRYPIAGVNYSASPITITLVDSNTIPSGQFRRDLILGTTLGTVIKRTGTPGISAAAPDYDPATEFVIKDILVASGATVGVDPTTGLQIVNESIYLNAAVNGWSFAASSGNITENNDRREGLNTSVTDKLTLTKNAVVNSAGVSNFIFDCEVENTFTTWFVNVYGVTNNLIGSVNFTSGVYGFDTSNQNSQTVIVPIGDFNLSESEFFRFEIFTNTLNGNWNIDNARLGIGSAISLNEKTLLSQLTNDLNFLSKDEILALFNTNGSDNGTGTTAATNADAVSESGSLLITGWATNYTIGDGPVLQGAPQSQMGQQHATKDWIVAAVFDKLGAMVLIYGPDFEYGTDPIEDYYPTILPTEYFFVKHFLIQNDTTEPLDPATGLGIVNKEVVYDESGTHVGLEYATTTNAPAAWTINSLTQAIKGNKCIVGSNINSSHLLIFTPNGEKTFGNYTDFQFRLKLGQLSNPYFSIGFRLMKNGKWVRNLIKYITNGKFGFNRNTLAEQYINVSKADMFWKDEDTFDAVEMYFTAHSPNAIPSIVIDQVQFITRTSTPVIPGIPIATGGVKLEHLNAEVLELLNSKIVHIALTPVIDWSKSDTQQYTCNDGANVILTEINTPGVGNKKTMTFDILGNPASVDLPGLHYKLSDDSRDFDGSFRNQLTLEWMSTIVKVTNSLIAL